MPEQTPESDTKETLPEHRDPIDPGGAAVREELVDLLRRDLLGPHGGPEEEIDVRPSSRYVLGMLAPGGQEVECEEDEELAQAGAGDSQDGTTEQSTPTARTRLPSSMGLSFAVGADCDAVRVTSRWGRYERAESETEVDEKTHKPTRVWRRNAVEAAIDALPLTPGPIASIPLSDKTPKVVIEGIVREREGQRIVSLFMVNRQEEPDKLKDEKWIFQPELKIEGTNGAAVFQRRSLRHETANSGLESSRETAEMDMLYRDEVEFAVGHGIAVHAEPVADDPTRAVSVATSTVPAVEVRQQTPPGHSDQGFEKLADVCLDMKVLAESPVDELTAKLSPLAEAYQSWIEREKARLAAGDDGLDGHLEAAQDSIEKCEAALARIEEGIELLSRDPQAAQAFVFANRAMWLQRIRTIYSEGVRQDKKPELDEIDADPNSHSWRPFQLAFILLNLASTTDLHHEDRSHETEALADLLWFPTGGGKTEAYLGLTAYVFALRRLQGPVEGRSGEHGVAVLMRYTLRLLTLQQFQRATALVCACETIRREDPKLWGENPFRIGLWVGQAATPNWTKQARDAIAQASGGGYQRGQSNTGSPIQLTNCPWCGSRLAMGKDMAAEPYPSKRGRTLLYCSDPLGGCDFSRLKADGEGIPVVVVDEEIYRLLPALVIATVDKFAQMPWNGRTQMLFGKVNGFCPRHGFRSPEVEDSDSHIKKGKFPAVKTVPHGPLRPPDLIIQDELHLISGPLGSLVGLYETVVDELCCYEVDGKRVRPKLIASTATIRNAKSQVSALFLRKVEIFPPSGTTASDNFFSLRRPVSELPGRLYLGICAPGKRLKAVLIRVYVALLASSQLLYEKHGKAADPWMTLLGYFNSLRELGGMRRLVGDDIRTRLRGIDRWGLATRSLYEENIEELTSRKTSTDIPEILDRLEVGFDPAVDRKREKAKKEKSQFRSPHPYDVMLATNMVSVGVDVKRLGLMVVGGQPKGTSEYIQATSRIGRHSPGLVVTVLNWARPRDLSHYESFEHYHTSFYKHVESLSVTPFAKRALDRGLSGLLVSLIRLGGFEYTDNADASKVSDKSDLVRRAITTIASRAAEVLCDKDASEAVETELQARLDHWLALANGQNAANLAYRNRRDGTTVALLDAPSTHDWATYTCLNSLRDVEPTSRFVLIDDGLTQGDE